MRFVSDDGEVSAPIAGVPEVMARGQGGLLDVTLHPDFADNRLVYWSYSEAGDGGTNGTAIARGRLAEDMASLGDVEVIFRQQPKVQSNNHFGSRLVFDNDGFLFATLGERSSPQFRVMAQDLGTHLGKVIRIRDDGSVPDDNPFVGQAGAMPEIWSYGHRNPQGMALHPVTGAIWTHEHGPRGGDEVGDPQGRRQSRLADLLLRHRILGRPHHRPRRAPARIRAAGLVVDAVDRAVGHGLLRRRRNPRMAGATSSSARLPAQS